MKNIFLALAAVLIAANSLFSQTTTPDSTWKPGVIIEVYQMAADMSPFPRLVPNQLPNEAFRHPTINFLSPPYGQPISKEISDHYMAVVSGNLTLTETTEYQFRLSGNDGIRFTLDGKILIDNGNVMRGNLDGRGDSTIERIFKMEIKAGSYPFELVTYNIWGDQALQWEWYIPGLKAYAPLPSAVFSSPDRPLKTGLGIKKTFSTTGRMIPGDQNSVDKIHPAYDHWDLRPEGFTAKIGGMDFMPDGQLMVTNWGLSGEVYALDGLTGDSPKPTATKLASGLSEPTGLAVIGKDIFALQKYELTKLEDLNNDGKIDKYTSLYDGWSSATSSVLGAGGLVSDGKDFYTYINGAEKSLGRLAKISSKGEFNWIGGLGAISHGLGMDSKGTLFYSMHQGDPYSPGAIMSVTNKEAEPEISRIALLPKTDIAGSPSAISWLKSGPYKDQMIIGDLEHGGIKRVTLQSVNGQYQGCVFRFSQGFEAGVHRLLWGPDDALYVGGIGYTNNWKEPGKRSFGLQKIKYNGQSVFEMKTVKAFANGFEIEFTESIRKGEGAYVDDYQLRQWGYEGMNMIKTNEDTLKITGVQVDESRKKVFLEVAGLKAETVVHLHIVHPFVSEKDHSLWSTEAWYTLNQIPTDAKSKISSTPSKPMNSLTKEEAASGWELLFDGESISQWRSFGVDSISSGWQIEDGAITVMRKRSGYILTKNEYENFELSLEWKIAPGGNSGIFFHVKEDGYKSVWKTGPEMQILDNIEAHDNKLYSHLAGGNYDVHPPAFEALNPVGSFNKARLIVKDGHVSHWLNGYKIVEYTLGSDEWEKEVAKSKFASLKEYGRTGKGHIALQDHGDRVWFRNIKIKKLD